MANINSAPADQTARRNFLLRSSTCLGGVALAALCNGEESTRSATASASGSYVPQPLLAKAKRVIYLFMHGGPAQMELFDYKPKLAKLHGTELPDSIRGTQRLTGMTSKQNSFPVINPAPFRFRQHGASGAWVSDALPKIGAQSDDICIVRSLHTEAINHDPAVTHLQTGDQRPGRPSIGAWLDYGIGSESAELPSFVVMISRGSAARPADPLYARLWGSGFLPSNHQGVQFRESGDPVLYLKNPPGVDAKTRRRMLDSLGSLNRHRMDAVPDPEISTRIKQFESAYRMQTSVPDLADLSDESRATFDLYGDDAKRSGSFASNCLMARRLVERGVRFVQLYHRGWDQHYNLPSDLRLQCQDVDQACAGLLIDLKQRGLLDDTLIVWGGEFGRTVYGQGKLSDNDYGRDHHGRCFTMWLAGGGIRPGMTYGATDDFSYNIVENPVHVHDLNATILHCLGIDHERLTYSFQGRDYRLTDVHGQVVTNIVK
jgi:hypothetical protein